MSLAWISLLIFATNTHAYKILNYVTEAFYQHSLIFMRWLHCKEEKRTQTHSHTPKINKISGSFHCSEFNLQDYVILDKK